MNALCIAIAFVATAALLAVVALYCRELRRITRFLRERDSTSNARLRVETTLPGIRRLLRALNGQLYREAEAVRARIAAQRAFEQDMMCLSHDVRTPLAGAKGYMQLAAAEPDAVTREEYLRLAQERMDSAQLLLDQLLSYMRSIGGDLGECAEINVIPILEAALLANFGAFQDAGMNVEVDLGDEPLIVFGNEAALRRIFDNLVVNACVHGTDSFAVSRDVNRITLSNPLRDGTIPDKERVFSRFYRGDDARTRPGAGLGLAIVKNLASSMGIKPAVDIKDNRFTVELLFATF